MKATGEMKMEELLALPVSVGLMDAARALRIGQSKAYELAARDQFPCPVKKLGAAYRVNRADLFRELGLDPGLARAPEAKAS